MWKTVAQLSEQIHNVVLAQHAAEGRAALQAQELARLCGKCRELQSLVDNLEGPRRASAEAREKMIREQQELLLGRLDRMLQTMMEKASPELSENETKWFEELRRMKEEVIGAGRYDEGSLLSRTRSVRIRFSP